MHTVSSTSKRLAPLYHPIARIQPDTITTQKKRVIRLKVGH